MTWRLFVQCPTPTAACLHDSHTLEIRELGGTGRVHDWSLSREIIERSPQPVFLAGGITPENVRAAIESCRPYGVDLCSGGRTDGRLDEAKLARLTTALWS